MKNNKKIMLSLAMVAIIAVAAIGIGYAYTATTSNTSNNVGVDYIEIKPSADGSSSSYSAAMTVENSVIEWNTETISDSKVLFELANPSDATNVNGYQKVGSLYVLVLDSTAADGTKFILNVSSSTGLNTTYYNYKLVFGHGTDKTNADSSATTNASSGTVDKDWVNYTGTAIAYNPSTPMAKGEASVIKMDVYVAPTDALTTTGLTVGASLVKPLTDADFRFSLSTQYTVVITAGSNMSITTSNGTQKVDIGTAIANITVKAGAEKTFASNYMGATDGHGTLSNGLTFTVNGTGTGNSITIQGTPNASGTIALTNLD